MPIKKREKSYFQPLTITIVRFSTLNSKTRHLAPSNYRNRAKYTPKPNPPRFSATSLVHVAPMATSATLSSLFLSQTGGPPPLLSLLSFSSHPLLSRRTPSPAPLAPPLAGAAPRTPVAGARRRPHSPLLPAGPWRALTLLSSPRRRQSWLACRPRAAAELARRPACRRRPGAAPGVAELARRSARGRRPGAAARSGPPPPPPPCHTEGRAELRHGEAETRSGGHGGGGSPHRS